MDMNAMGALATGVAVESASGGLSMPVIIGVTIGSVAVAEALTAGVVAIRRRGFTVNAGLIALIVGALLSVPVLAVIGHGHPMASADGDVSAVESAYGVSDIRDASSGRPLGSASGDTAMRIDGRHDYLVTFRDANGGRALGSLDVNDGRAVLTVLGGASTDGGGVGDEHWHAPKVAAPSKAATGDETR